MTGFNPENGMEDELGRSALTLTKRVGLLERDRAQQSRTLTSLIESVQKGFTQAQLEQLRVLFREELADAGLRIDGPEHVDDAREDFRFLRRLRKGLNGYASKVGWVVIAAVLGGLVWIVTLGLNTWRGLP